MDHTEFDAERQRLDLYLDFRKGGRFTCPECGKGGCPAHDTTEKTWRHLAFFQHEAFLLALVKSMPAAAVVAVDCSQSVCATFAPGVSRAR